MGRLFCKELARPIADYWKPRAVISQNEKPAREVLELVEGLPSVPTPDLLPSRLRCAKTLAKVLTDDEVRGSGHSRSQCQLTKLLNSKLDGLDAQYADQVGEGENVKNTSRWRSDAPSSSVPHRHMRAMVGGRHRRHIGARVMGERTEDRSPQVPTDARRRPTALQGGLA